MLELIIILIVAWGLFHLLCLVGPFILLFLLLGAGYAVLVYLWELFLANWYYILPPLALVAAMIWRTPAGAADPPGEAGGEDQPPN